MSGDMYGRGLVYVDIKYIIQERTKVSLTGTLEDNISFCPMHIKGNKYTMPKETEEDPNTCRSSYHTYSTQRR